MEKIAIYNFQCPNCGKEIDNIRLDLKAPCRKDLDINDQILIELCSKLDFFRYISFIYEELKKRNRLEKIKELYTLLKDVKKFEEFFKSAVGSKPWSAQKTWFLRVKKNISFSITAPTGMGKTTFGLVTSLYLAREGKKSYIVLPTKVLVEQALEKINSYMDNLGIIDIDVIAYTKTSKKIKEEISKGNFDVLITSNQFLARNFDSLLSDKKFDFIFVDDVDALLKSSKNIDRTLKLIGFSEEDIDLAWKIIKMKISLAKELKEVKDREKVEEKINILRKLENKLEKIRKIKNVGVLILSSATGKARGLRVKLYRELLNFEIGSSKIGVRNIIDIYKYPEKDIKSEVLDLVEKLEDGILVFVTTDQGKEFAVELAEFLKGKGIKAEAAIAGRSDVIGDFAEGKLNVLVGVAHYYGVIVRGLDLPHRVKYAIFTGVPRFKFSSRSEETDPRRIAMLLRTIIDFVDDKEEYNKILRQLYENLNKLSQGALVEVKKAIEEGRKLEGFLGYVQELSLKARDLALKALEDPNVIRRIEEYPYLDIQRGEEEIILLVPDVRTYIQASGRTSRLYAGGVTKGVSIVLVDNEKLLNGLMRALRWRFD